MSEEKKFCPVNNHPLSSGMCMKNQCAWWDDEDEWCVIRSIANYIGHLWSMGLPEKGTQREK